MSEDKSHKGKSSEAKPRRPQDWSAEERLRVVMEGERMSSEQLGEFLRAKGLHEAQLKEWPAAALSALRPAPKKKRQSTEESKRLRQLEKELRRKDKALAETAALLVLQI